MDSGKVLDHRQQISDRDSICEAHTTSHWFTRADERRVRILLVMVLATIRSVMKEWKRHACRLQCKTVRGHEAIECPVS
jgi:hypothetical protein